MPGFEISVDGAVICQAPSVFQVMPCYDAWYDGHRAVTAACNGRTYASHLSFISMVCKQRRAFGRLNERAPAIGLPVGTKMTTAQHHQAIMALEKLEAAQFEQPLFNANYLVSNPESSPLPKSVRAKVDRLDAVEGKKTFAYFNPDGDELEKLEGDLRRATERCAVRVMLDGVMVGKADSILKAADLVADLVAKYGKGDDKLGIPWRVAIFKDGKKKGENGSWPYGVASFETIVSKGRRAAQILMGMSHDPELCAEAASVGMRHWKKLRGVWELDQQIVEYIEGGDPSVGVDGAWAALGAEQRAALAVIERDRWFAQAKAHSEWPAYLEWQRALPEDSFEWQILNRAKGRMFEPPRGMSVTELRSYIIGIAVEMHRTLFLAFLCQTGVTDFFTDEPTPGFDESSEALDDALEDAVMKAAEWRTTSSARRLFPAVPRMVDDGPVAAAKLRQTYGLAGPKQEPSRPQDEFEAMEPALVAEWRARGKAKWQQMQAAHA